MDFSHVFESSGWRLDVRGVPAVTKKGIIYQRVDKFGFGIVVSFRSKL